jgi:murein DD-endopeptidase MepM/ murein hydrolase activator NlpD
VIGGTRVLTGVALLIAVSVAGVSAGAAGASRPETSAVARNNASVDLVTLTEEVEASRKPFGLPFAEPPGPGTWFVSQSYGNTVFAYYERDTMYRNGQGLHMGLDLAAACGTPVVSVADGTVISVDGRGGSLPHNLMIEHDNGFVSFYGHLLERAQVAVGQRVTRGQHVADSGDMYGTCYDAPHLHLEIRDATLNHLYNPVDFIDADWQSILLLGASAPVFERDLDAPRRWQSIDDQPHIDIGGPLLNAFERAWPSDGR